MAFQKYRTENVLNVVHNAIYIFKLCIAHFFFIYTCVCVCVPVSICTIENCYLCILELYPSTLAAK